MAVSKAGAILYIQSWFQSRFPAEHFSPDIRPKLRCQIADQIEAECHGTLNNPEARRIEPVRIPLVREKGRAIGASYTPRGQRFATAIGASEHCSPQRVSRPAPEPCAA